MTVESLTVGGEKSGERYNIRTTEQKIEKVKQAVLDSFGTALQRVELKRRPADADRRRPPPDARQGRRQGEGRGQGRLEPTGSPAAGSTT